MNIFHNPEDLLVRASVDALMEADKAFFATAVEIRGRLGKKAYVLDRYLTLLLESINYNFNMLESVECGDNAFRAVRRIARGAVEQDEIDEQDEPLYQQIRDAVAKYSAQFQEKYTAYDLACVAGYREVLPEMAKEFVQDTANEMSAKYDNIRIRELFNEVSRGAGEEHAEKLNDLIMRRFLITPALDVFLQAFAHQYLFCLLRRDEETGRMIFQLVLDEMALGDTPLQPPMEG